MGDLLNSFIPEEECLIEKLVRLVHNLVRNTCGNYYECDILINELKNIVYQRNLNINTVESSK